jgi:hypothetical protein
METCDIIAANYSLEAKSELHIFPNPTSGSLRISMEPEALKSIRVYSIMGVLVTEFQNTNTINISHLDDGIYLVETISKNGERGVKKIIKEGW